MSIKNSFTNKLTKDLTDILCKSKDFVMIKEKIKVTRKRCRKASKEMKFEKESNLKESRKRIGSDNKGLLQKSKLMSKSKIFQCPLNKT
ncbi:CLUMA_CG021085, isoform A [Clunio marinus]|uniref:CLUMA_CG021085, isoform A n=1 Tax=Clunio marinus TaxID=568069 RepID=A0A1J1JAG2_9DIPT|nr:CLUMA_CG021085, isoform A [Clunio marinus]